VTRTVHDAIVRHRIWGTDANSSKNLRMHNHISFQNTVVVLLDRVLSKYSEGC